MLFQASSGYKKCQPYLEISANMAATKKQETQISTGFDRKGMLLIRVGY